MTIPKFRELVWKHHKEYGRHGLPWRGTGNPYNILVSEVMLQQTQVERVLPYYATWLKSFPTAKKLANASLADVLSHWQGLGYNRRAKMLHEAGKVVARDFKGMMPQNVEELESLPGVGHYTARAVAAFAYNQDVVFIETNIRTVITHHFFNDRDVVADAEVYGVLEQALPKGSARQWYAALMDYGAHLKRSGVRINSKSKTYTKQSAFIGSGREVRGVILRTLIKGKATPEKLIALFEPSRKEQVIEQISKLHKEKLITKIGRSYTLPI